jgi:phosphoribosylformylglycinamidine synthase PurS subunit
MKVKVIVTPKETVLDPQGAAVREAMQHLGFSGAREVRIVLKLGADERA